MRKLSMPPGQRAGSRPVEPTPCLLPYMPCWRRASAITRRARSRSTLSRPRSVFTWAAVEPWQADAPAKSENLPQRDRGIARDVAGLLNLRLHQLDCRRQLRAEARDAPRIGERWRRLHARSGGADARQTGGSRRGVAEVVRGPEAGL